MLPCRDHQVSLEASAEPVVLRSHLGRPDGEETEGSPCTSGRGCQRKLGRPAQLMKDPIVKGKLTGMALHIPTINISAVDLTVKIEK